MTTNLDAIYTSDSVAFRVSTYDVDGVTLITPTSCVCSVYKRADGSAIVSDAAGTVGSGFAQYNWPGTSTAGWYDAVLSITLASGVINSQEFAVQVLAKPTKPFTFDAALSGDLDKLRFEIGDTVADEGVMPNGANIPDATLNALLTSEGSVGLAAARACEILSRHWAKIAASQSVGGRSESNQQAANFRQQAADLRSQYGGGGATLSAGVIALDFIEKDADDTTELDSGEL